MFISLSIQTHLTTFQDQALLDLCYQPVAEEAQNQSELGWKWGELLSQTSWMLWALSQAAGGVPAVGGDWACTGLILRQGGMDGTWEV